MERDTTKFEIRASRALRVATDGEVTTMASPLRYLSRPKALRVMVPVAPAEGS
jgi:diacylglycerol kinase family enzyme